MLRFCVRLWIEDELVLEEMVEGKNAEDLKQKAGEHAMIGALLAAKHPGKPYMAELDFVDEPDDLQRYMRFGTDPRRMVRPAAFVSLKKSSQ